MPVAGPYFLSWIDEGTAFNPAVHNRMDEYVFSYRLVLSEGDKPTLEMVIRNPHIGLLHNSRKQWAWFAREINGVITPLFYGRLKAAPKDILRELMTINLVAWPIDYNTQRQALAQQIKSAGPYDEVFIEVAKRDDPDVLLEAISGLYHIDPVTHVVSISDVLNGEDGNVDITGDDHLYAELTADFDQTNNLTAILMDATVTWNQTGQGFIDMGSQQIRTFAGDAVISEWPKPLSSLGGGWTVATANAIDSNGVQSIMNGSFSVSWTNKEKQHNDGDQLSLNFSINMPVGLSGNSQSAVINYHNQTGFVDPFATDGNGDPSPTNIPAHTDVTLGFVPEWLVSTTLMLQYRDLERARTERIQMLLQSDLQEIIVNPEVEQTSETIVKNGADVGIPIIRVLNWTTVSGQAVSLDTIVIADHPALPGQRSAQIAVVAGTAGTTQPNFSDIPGTPTTDGTVTWASLGVPAPSETAFDWAANTNIGLGTIILPRRPLYLTWRQLTQGGRQQFPRVGTQVSRGQLIQSSNGAFQVCTLAGLGSSINEPAFSTTRGVVTTDGSAEWTCLGTAIPDGKTHFLCIEAGKTGAEFMVPQFDNALHAQTTDGTVLWASIGQGSIPAGGTPGDVWARSYFDTVRGNRSIEYLISIMRARGRLKARAVNVEFVPIDPFGKGLDLTLRKTASVHDPRLGGGIAAGKVIYREHRCDGQSGREDCLAKIGCAIGKDNVIEAVEGEETYVEDYVDNYFATEGEIRVLSDESDVGYTPPSFATNDDGLVFPLSKIQVVISEGVRSSGDQEAAVASVLGNMSAVAQLSATATGSLDGSAALQQQISQLSGYNINTATALNPIWYDLVLKPLSGWQFNNFYPVTLTKLTCQKGVDLSAASTP